ncbi:MAG: hypothetical protein L0G99_04185 [Propionibacteriales bacterium]|nr:hypothetical protein [Propionibacteriales bacterium]
MDRTPGDPFGGTQPTPGTLFSTPGAASGSERDRKRSRTAGLVAAVLAMAVVLGVALALVLNIAVFNKKGAEPEAPPIESASEQDTVPSVSPTAASPASPSSPSSTPEAPVDANAVADKVGSGVVTVLATGCRAGDGVGTGILINDRQVITTWSAIATPASVVIQTADGTPITGQVSRVSSNFSLALINLDRSVKGYQFVLGEPYPDTGPSEAALLMRGLHQGLEPSTAEVSGQGASAQFDGQSIGPVRALDIGADQVIQGGPAVDADGAVRGMVLTLPDGEDTFLVGPEEVQKLIDGDGAAPSPTDCDQLLGPVGPIQSAGTRQNDTLTRYFEGINAGDYDKAYSTFTDRQKNAVKGVDQAAEGWASTYDFNIKIISDSGSTVRVTFDSIFKQGQGPEEDMTCARWDLNYRMVDGKIDAAKIRAGKGYTRC